MGVFKWSPLLFISSWFIPSTKQPQWEEKERPAVVCCNINVWRFIWSCDVFLTMEELLLWTAGPWRRKWVQRGRVLSGGLIKAICQRCFALGQVYVLGWTGTCGAAAPNRCSSGL